MEKTKTKMEKRRDEQAVLTREEGRILARKVARELTAEEIDQVSGGVAAKAGTSFSGPCCCADDCRPC